MVEKNQLTQSEIRVILNYDMKYYNRRNTLGQFTRNVKRARNGRFVAPFEIVAGRLYDWRGATVRASDTLGDGRSQ